MHASNTASWLRPIVTLGGVVLVTAVLYWARVVLVPLALAAFLAFVLAPAVNALQRRGPGRVSSVLIIVFLAAGLLGGVGYLVGDQFAGLIERLPDYREVIAAKFKTLSDAEGGGPLKTVRRTLREIDRRITEADATREHATQATAEAVRGGSADNPLYMQVVESGWTGLFVFAGPAAEGLASALLVLVLVVFMLMQRENLRNRLVWLIGNGRLVVTTRAIDEGARRISKFLVMQLCVNAGFGLALTLALVVLSFCTPSAEDATTLRHYAFLWGFICGLLRFVPYVGTWVGAALLFAFSVATLHGWTLPLILFVVFLVLELATANAVEPLLFGQSTGVSPLALLLCAAFWAWLWGPIGLLLSTPLTVVLIVLGKYVPQLEFLEVLLSDERVLHRHVVLYQRLVANDQDEASDLVDEYARSHSPEETYQDVFLPTLIQARVDLERGELDDESAGRLFRMIRELIDEIAPQPTASAAEEVATPMTVPGCPARDPVDELSLRMFGHLLRAQSRRVDILSSESLMAEVLEKLADTCPGVVVIASIPPGGLAQARYLCKRIKMQCPGIKVVVGRWGARDDGERMQERLTAAGADFVGATLVETRAEVVARLQVAEANASTGARLSAVELAEHG